MSLNQYAAPRRAFTMPTNHVPQTSAASRQDSDSIELLFTHPSARIISFHAVTPQNTLNAPPSQSQALTESPALSWSSTSERTLSSGLIKIYRVKFSTAFLQCGSILHPLLPKSAAWCVDEGRGVFVLRIRLGNYWRVEILDCSDVQVEALKSVLRNTIVFEKTACPFRVERMEKLFEEQIPLAVFKRRRSTITTRPVMSWTDKMAEEREKKQEEGKRDTVRLTFETAPVVAVEKRRGSDFPVEITLRPLPADDDEEVIDDSLSDEEPMFEQEDVVPRIRVTKPTREAKPEITTEFEEEQMVWARELLSTNELFSPDERLTAEELLQRRSDNNGVEDYFMSLTEEDEHYSSSDEPNLVETDSAEPEPQEEKEIVAHKAVEEALVEEPVVQVLSIDITDGRQPTADEQPEAQDSTVVDEFARLRHAREAVEQMQLPSPPPSPVLSASPMTRPQTPVQGLPTDPINSECKKSVQSDTASEGESTSLTDVQDATAAVPLAPVRQEIDAATTAPVVQRQIPIQDGNSQLDASPSTPKRARSPAPSPLKLNISRAATAPVVTTHANFSQCNPPNFAELENADNLPIFRTTQSITIPVPSSGSIRIAKRGQRSLVSAIIKSSGSSDLKFLAGEDEHTTFSRPVSPQTSTSASSSEAFSEGTRLSTPQSTSSLCVPSLNFGDDSHYIKDHFNQSILTRRRSHTTGSASCTTMVLQPEPEAQFSSLTDLAHRTSSQILHKTLDFAFVKPSSFVAGLMLSLASKIAKGSMVYTYYWTNNDSVEIGRSSEEFGPYAWTEFGGDGEEFEDDFGVSLLGKRKYAEEEGSWRRGRNGSGRIPG